MFFEYHFIVFLVYCSYNYFDESWSCMVLSMKNYRFELEDEKLKNDQYAL